MKKQEQETAKFRDVTISLTQNGWVIIDGLYSIEDRGVRHEKWIAKTPQEIAEIFTKYAIKPALYKGLR